jgi:peptidoglycan/xylan/chitin deacetylase (PgdA/CDA1 family)
MKPLFIILLALATLNAQAEQLPVEIHDQLAVPSKNIALTLDACGGKYDEDLINFLIQNRIPTTIFATKKWLNRNPQGLTVIKAHLDLFDVEDHGEKHIPAVIGKDRTVYGIPGEPDVIHLRREVVEGAHAVEKATGVAPHWYRGATGEYDAQAVKEIEKLGYKIAGFSVNADSGATLKKRTIEKRLKQVKAGDVIIAHMNKPESDSAEGLAVGLAVLQKEGFVFVRLDQVDLIQIPEKPHKEAAKQKKLQPVPPAVSH